MSLLINAHELSMYVHFLINHYNFYDFEIENSNCILNKRR